MAEKIANLEKEKHELSEKLKREMENADKMKKKLTAMKDSESALLKKVDMLTRAKEEAQDMVRKNMLQIYIIADQKLLWKVTLGIQFTYTQYGL